MVVIACGLLFLSGWLAGRSWERNHRPTAPIDSIWTVLPSGWSRNVGSLSIYAMAQNGKAYWWVSRNGRTIIEGPSKNIDVAKVEAEREARELAC